MGRSLEKTVKEAGKLEVLLKRELGLTEKQIRQAKFREKGIQVNGERCRITRELQPGDVVQVLLEGDTEQKMVPTEGTLNILYEDEDLLILNKPAGIVVHPSHGHYSDSILNLAAGYYEKQGKTVVLHVVGRLDKETSGVLVLAKNQIAAARLAQQKAEGIFEKEYLAIPAGMPVPDHGTIQKGIAKDPNHLNKMIAVEERREAADQNETDNLKETEMDSGSKTSELCGVAAESVLSAVTHYERYEDSPMLRVKIETGRTHQIRVHLSSIGAALAGDTLYGVEDPVIKRAALHAWRVKLLQPFSGESLEFCAEIPEDFQSWMQELQKIQANHL